MHEGKGKQFPRWRPIQCMLSLTENEAPETGGFECVRGFHRHFAQYYSSGKGSSCSQRGPVGASFLFDEADGIYLCFLESVTSTSLILLCMCVCVCVCVKQNRALLARRVRQFAKEISAPSALRRTGPSLRHLNMLQWGLVMLSFGTSAFRMRIPDTIAPSMREKSFTADFYPVFRATASMQVCICIWKTRVQSCLYGVWKTRVQFITADF
jgi:hypothetical protein